MTREQSELAQFAAESEEICREHDQISAIVSELGGVLAYHQRQLEQTRGAARDTEEQIVRVDEEMASLKAAIAALA